MERWIKRREIAFSPLHPDPCQAESAAARLRPLKGVEEVQVFHPLRLCVRYDLLETTLLDLEEALIAQGYHLDNSLMSKLKRALAHYVEENQRAALGCERGQSHCLRRIFIQHYQDLPHGCRDKRPEHWRRYL